ncbi:MAG TPA: hypothetical protein ACYCDB_01570 [Candidatus Azoamicus sp.]
MFREHNQIFDLHLSIFFLILFIIIFSLNLDIIFIFSFSKISGRVISFFLRSINLFSLLFKKYFEILSQNSINSSDFDTKSVSQFISIITADFLSLLIILEINPSVAIFQFFLVHLERLFFLNVL